MKLFRSLCARWSKAASPPKGAAPLPAFLPKLVELPALSGAEGSFSTREGAAPTEACLSLWRAFVRKKLVEPLEFGHRHLHRITCEDAGDVAKGRTDMGAGIVDDDLADVLLVR